MPEGFKLRVKDINSKATPPGVVSRPVHRLWNGRYWPSVQAPIADVSTAATSCGWPKSTFNIYDMSSTVINGHQRSSTWESHEKITGKQVNRVLWRHKSFIMIQVKALNIFCSFQNRTEEWQGLQLKVSPDG
jgi:hypothetical protein